MGAYLRRAVSGGIALAMLLLMVPSVQPLAAQDSPAPDTVSYRAGPVPIGYDDPSSFHSSLIGIPNGNLRLRFVDVVVASASPAFVLARQYASTNGRVGVFGRGWSSTLDESLEPTPGTSGVQIVEPDGRLTLYDRSGSTFSSVMTGAGTLEPTSSGYERTLPNERDRFDQRGRLVERDLGATAYTYAYAGARDRIPVTVGIPGGGRVAIRSANGVVTDVVDPSGRDERYAYGGERLIQTTDALGRSDRFTYDRSELLIRMTLPLGESVAFAFDGSARLQAVAGPGALRSTFVWSNDTSAGGVVLAQRRADGSVRRTTFSAALAGGAPALTVSIQDANAPTTSEAITDAAAPAANSGPPALTGDDWRALVGPDAFSTASGITRDAAGRPMRFALPDGTTETWIWDAGDRVSAWTDADGRTTRYTYDAENRLTAIRPPSGSPSAYTYGPNGLLVQSAAGGLLTRFTYNAAGALLAVTSNAGDALQMGYGAGGRLGSLAQNGATYPVAHDGSGRITALGGSTFTYDAAGRLSGATSFDGTATQYQYGSDGSSTEVETSIDGATRTIEQDARGKVVSIKDGTATSFVATYDATGALMATTAADGTQQNLSYDKRGRIASIAGAASNAALSYDPDGTVHVVLTGAGGTTRYDKDPDGTIRRVVLPDGTTATVANGNDAQQTVRITSASGPAESYTYDADGSPLRFDTVGGTERFARTATGEDVRLTDPLGATTQLHADDAARTIRVVDPLGDATTTVYDALERPLSFVDALGARTAFTYNTAGSLASLRWPDGITFRLRYDAAGRVIGRSAGPRERITYAYDAQGRRTATRYDGALASSFTYDDQNRLTSFGTGNAQTALSYDAAGLLASESEPFAKTGYAYDGAGNLTDVSGPIALHYRYDAGGNPVEVDGPAGATRYVYDGAGRITQVTYGNGTVAAYGYDAKSELVTLDYRASSGAVIEHLRYAYDAAGRMQSVATLAGSTRYQHDRAGRLTAAVTGARSERYAYDAAGNLRSDSAAGAAYDNDGNLVRLGHGAFSFDAGGNLTRAQPGHDSATYAYDGIGRRITRVAAGGTTHYAYAGSAIVAELDGNDAVRRSFTPGREAGVWDAVTIGGSSYFPIRDQQGSLLALSDAQGRVVERFTYDPYGKVLTRAGNPLVEPEFAGGAIDPISGWIPFGVRWYAPQLGRFVSSDPLGPDTRGNLYAYAIDDPVDYVDRTGAGKIHISGPRDANFEADVANAIIDASMDPSNPQRQKNAQIMVDQLSRGTQIQAYPDVLLDGQPVAGLYSGTTGDIYINIAASERATAAGAYPSAVAAGAQSTAHEIKHAIQQAEGRFSQYGTAGKLLEAEAEVFAKPFAPGMTNEKIAQFVNKFYQGPPLSVQQVNGIENRSLIPGVGRMLAGVPPPLKFNGAVAQAVERVAETEAASLASRAAKKAASAVDWLLSAKSIPYLSAALEVYNAKTWTDRVLAVAKLNPVVAAIAQAKDVVDQTIGAGRAIGEVAANLYIRFQKAKAQFYKPFDDLIAALDAQSVQQKLRKKRAQNANSGAGSGFGDDGDELDSYDPLTLAPETAVAAAPTPVPSTSVPSQSAGTSLPAPIPSESATISGTTAGSGSAPAPAGGVAESGSTPFPLVTYQLSFDDPQSYCQHELTTNQPYLFNAGNENLLATAMADCIKQMAAMQQACRQPGSGCSLPGSSNAPAPQPTPSGASAVAAPAEAPVAAAASSTPAADDGAQLDGLPPPQTPATPAPVPEPVVAESSAVPAAAPTPEPTPYNPPSPDKIVLPPANSGVPPASRPEIPQAGGSSVPSSGNPVSDFFGAIAGLWGAAARALGGVAGNIK